TPKRTQALQRPARRSPKICVRSQNGVKLLRKKIDRPDVRKIILHRLAGRLANGKNGELESPSVHGLDFANAKRLAEGRKAFKEIGETKRRRNPSWHDFTRRPCPAAYGPAGCACPRLPPD